MRCRKSAKDMLINVYSAKCIGINAEPVTVEVEISAGIGIHLVGLADIAVKESLLRTVTAIKFLGYRIPGRKIIINLAPADVHKNGSGYDLPIAIGILAASGQCSADRLGNFIMMGELGLDGSVRAVRGALPIAEFAAGNGYAACILPAESSGDAAPYYEDRVYAVENLSDVIDILSGKEDCSGLLLRNTLKSRRESDGEECLGTDCGADCYGGCDGAEDYRGDYPDFADIIGQAGAKRAMEIAAAGGHNIILAGPPGSGKSSIAKAMAGILPPMTPEEAVQTRKIYSVSSVAFPQGRFSGRPFRAPHYSISVPALLGGGSDTILPGEISFAHGGVLFIDEFCEAPKKVIECLRAPMEDGRVTISRLKNKVTFPSSFILVCATNPCPCGYYGDGAKCSCTPSQRKAYLSKLSGPVMDRIDLQVFMRAVPSSDLVSGQKAESSEAIARRVQAARDVQRRRFSGSGIFTNAQMNGTMLDRFCPLDKPSREFLQRSIDLMGLSARSCSRVVRMARTIADLEGCADIGVRHLSEAVSYRVLDKL